MLTAADGPEVARIFGLGDTGHLVGPVARGELGQVWRLTTATGRWAVKESFDAQDAAAAAACGALQASALAAGVPTPHVLTTPGGAYLAHLRAVPLRGCSWVDVHDRDPMLDPVAVGRTVAAVHRVRRWARGEHPHPWHTEPVGASRWHELTRRASAASAPFADRLAAVVDDLVAVEQVLEPMTAVQWCHLDLWADNLRGTPDGGVCVLDWDNAGPADPDRELAMVLFEFGRTDPARLRALYTAYLDAEGPARVRRPADFGLVVAQLGHIGERHLSMWLDPRSNQEVRGRAADGVDELLSFPLTLTVVEAILDTLAD